MTASLVAGKLSYAYSRKRHGFAKRQKLYPHADAEVDYRANGVRNISRNLQIDEQLLLTQGLQEHRQLAREKQLQSNLEK